MADRSILYIEDNPENRLLVRRTLEASGYSVKEAVDGPSGLKAATESHPDVILLDISLPAMDGYDLARRFSEYAHLDDVPVLAVTANVMKGDKERALGAGCDGYIPKPINIDQLPKEIEEALQRVGRDGGGSEPAEGGTPPARAEEEEKRSEVVAEPPDPESKASDPSNLSAADADDGSGLGTERDHSAKIVRAEAHAESVADPEVRDDEVEADPADVWRAADGEEGQQRGQEVDSLDAEAGDADPAAKSEAPVRRETDDAAGKSAGHPEADQTGDDSVERGDEVLDDAEDVGEAPSFEATEGIRSRASGSAVEAADEEGDREVAPTVAAPDQGLSEDEMLLREIFGPPTGGIDGGTGTEEDKGNGADRGPEAFRDDADLGGEKPVTRGDGSLGSLGRVGAEDRTGTMEETEEPSAEAEAVADGAREGVETPADEIVGADRVVEKENEGFDDGSRRGEEMSTDPSVGADDTVSDGAEPEGVGEADIEPRRVQDEVDDEQASEPVAGPQPPSAGTEESGPDGPEADGGEPGLPLEREAAVVDVMNGLADELGAEAVVLTQGPHVLASAGQMRPKRKEQLAAILAAGFEASDRVASLLGCEQGCREQIVDIGDFSIHARAVNGDLVMSTAIRSVVPLGAARLQVKRSAARVESLVGEWEEE